MAGNSLDTYVMDLRARTAKLESDLDKANKKIRAKMRRSGSMMAKDFTAGFKKAGAALGVTAGLDLVRRKIIDTVAESSQLQTTADKLGVTTTALQEMRFAASQMNVEQTTTDMALQRFTRRLGEADQGIGELKGTLDQYNISTRDSSGQMRSTMDVLRDYADVIQGAESEQERLRLAFKAFDSEGVSFVNILRDGSSGLAEFRVAAHGAGQVIESETIARLDKANKRFKEFKGLISTLFTELVGKTFNISDSLGISGLEAELDKINSKLQNSAVLSRGANAEKWYSRFFILSDEEKNRLLTEQNATAEALLKQRLELSMDMQRRFKEAQTLLNETDEGSPGRAVLEQQSLKLSEELTKLDASIDSLIKRYPELAAVAQELEPIVTSSAQSFALTAEETADLASILNSTETDAEKFRAKILTLGKAIQAQPERVEEFKEAIVRLGQQYEESLKPDKMDQLLATWEDMSDRMGSSLSEALISGEDALDNFLSRMLNKLAAAALETALIQPFLSFLGPIGGGIGSLLGFADGGDPPVGVPSIVGERGPELFVPKTAGTIIPNHALAGGGGSTVFNIKQDLHFDVGLESVDSRIASAAPLIAQATEAQILDKQRRGRR